MDQERRTLHDLGLAVTAPRLSVLRSLRRASHPRSAAEIHADVRADGSSTGLTTVYRTLTALVEANLVHAFDRHGESVYRLCGEQRHQHLVCRGCGLVVETVLDLDRALRDDAAADGFRIEEVHGICASCQTDDANRDPGNDEDSGRQGRQRPRH